MELSPHASLRDQYAMAALQGMLARSGSGPFPPFSREMEGYAAAAYMLADQMLIARVAPKEWPKDFVDKAIAEP